MESEEFSNPALQPVPLDRLPDLLADGNPQAWPALVIRIKMEDEKSRGVSSPSSRGSDKLGPPQEPGLFGE
jgi:hypothetical protein